MFVKKLVNCIPIITSRIDFKKISSERQKKMNVEEKITKSLNGAPSALDGSTCPG